MRNVNIILAEISDSLGRIALQVSKHTAATFEEDKDTQDIVCWHVVRIGEAVKQVPEDYRTEHSDVPWKEMAGMRDVLIHQYHRIETKRLWVTASETATPLKLKIDACIGGWERTGGTSLDVPKVVRETRAVYKVSQKRRKKKS